MIKIPPTTPPTIPPIAPPERPFCAEDDEPLPESPAPADAEMLFVVVGLGLPSVAVPVAGGTFVPTAEVVGAEFPPPGEVVVADEAGADEGATVPVIWAT